MTQKIDWTNHAIEFITVVIGILLAFGLNNYREDQKDIQQAKQYLQSIQEEIRENKKEVEKKLPYHNQLLQKVIDDPLHASIELKTSRVTDYAWQLSNNGIFKEHIDYTTYRVLAEVYSRQEQLNENNQATEETMTNINATSPYMIASGGMEAIKIIQDSVFKMELKRSWIPILQDLVYYETELLQSYEKALEQLIEYRHIKM